MTDPYQPQQAYPAADGHAAQPGRPMAKAAAIVLLLIATLMTLNVLFVSFTLDADALLEQSDPSDLAELEAQGVSTDTLAGFVRACGGGCGLLVLGVGVLLAAFTWGSKAWAIITSIVLLGLSLLLNGLGLLAAVVLRNSPDVAATTPLELAYSAMLLLLSGVGIVLLSLALRERGKQSAATQQQQHEAAWQQYYAQGGQPPQDQQGWGGQ